METLCLLPPQYRYNWPISSPQKKTQERKLGSEKFKNRQLITDIDLLPDYTEYRNERVAKLKIKLTLGGVSTLESIYKAFVRTTLYDFEASQIIDQQEIDYEFIKGKSTIKFLVNLGKQEMIEKSTSKQLEIRVDIKVSKYK